MDRTELKEFLMSVRHVSLTLVDIIEKFLKMSPRTAELRKAHKEQQKETA